MMAILPHRVMASDMPVTQEVLRLFIMTTITMLLLDRNPSPKVLTRGWLGFGSY